MLRLYKHIALFLLPLLLALALLPVDRRMAYQGLKDDCFNHGIWIHDRLHRQAAPVDVAFFGSSHTINGIDDSLIEASLSPLRVANLGYCRLGRNLHFALLKELLEAKEPRCVVMEMREDENRYGHPIFPYLAGTKDVLLAAPFFNKGIAGDVWTHFAYKTELLQDVLYRPEVPAATQTALYGFSVSDDTVSVALLQEAAAGRKSFSLPENTLERNFYMRYPRAYLKKIGALCKSRDVRLCFLYLPEYGGVNRQPAELATYRALGSVWLPPSQILGNPDHWHDKSHLNQAGARALSRWVAERIAEIQ
ncbi:MAG: hypothetical protein R2791_11145 [Saprospiraceae bacterium]